MLKFAVLSLLIWAAESSNILGIFPTPNLENFAIGSKLMEELSKKGHNVTFVTAPFMEEYPNINLTYVYVENELEVLEKFTSNFMDRTSMGFIRSTYYYYNSAFDVTNALLSDTNFQYLLQSRQKFDLIVTEYSVNEAVLGIARIFNAPIVLVSPLPSSSIMTDVFANPAPASYVPNILTEHTGHMSYFDRMHNFLCNVFIENYRYMVALPWQEKLLNKYIDAKLSINDIIEDISLILLNSHSSVTEPVPHTPNMVEVGGLHITASKKLPNDVEDFINDAEHGVIYFSMDPNLHNQNLGFEKVDAILATFRRLPQRVLWDFEDKSTVRPNNVKFVRNIPHQDIIGHPKIKAVITDGNLFRIMEAVHFGVPIIGIPLFADQKSNMARVVHDKYGIEIRFDELAEKSLYASIQEILQNSEYSFNVKARSNVMNDYLVSPIDTAVYWLEYVIRHGGAKHFQSPGVHLPLYKRRLIDIIIVLTIIDVALFLIFYYIFKHITHRCIKMHRNRAARKYDQLETDTEK